MNKHSGTLEQEIHYKLLKILSEKQTLTQREMAQKVGISLGKMNYCLTELAKKGIIKINRFKTTDNKKKTYAYILTPRGIQEKAGITVSFLKKKIEEYDEIKRQIAELTREVEENGLETISHFQRPDILEEMLEFSK
jgi:EPS-associated MarR family transcriptional regulator